MRLLWILLAAALAPAPEDPARDIVRRSVVLNDRNAVLARNYTFVRRMVGREFDSHGREKSRESEHDISILFGQPYSRLIARDGRPLSPKEEKKEQEKLAKTFAQRKNETEAQRQERLAKEEKRRERARAFLREIPEIGRAHV